MYINGESSYRKRKFPEYVELFNGKNSLAPMKCITNKDTRDFHVTFDCRKTTIWACYNNLVIGVQVFVDKVMLDRLGDEVEVQCTSDFFKCLLYFFSIDCICSS